MTLAGSEETTIPRTAPRTPKTAKDEKSRLACVFFISALLLYLLPAAFSSALFGQELPRPTFSNSIIVSIEHSVTDSAEVDYVRNNFNFGLYAWPSFSFTALQPDLTWHGNWADAANGIQAFKDQVNALITAAKAKNVKTHIVITSGLARHLWIYKTAKEEDIRNAQWFNDNKLVSDTQITDPNFMNASVFGTLSRYARKLRVNLEAKGRAAAAFLKQKMDENPETLVAVSGWAEVELSYSRLNSATTVQDYFCDFSPFAVLEFRDWIQRAGLYNDVSGKYRGQGYSLGGAKYQGPGGLAQFNADFGTNFATWDLLYFNWTLADDFDQVPQDYVNPDPHAIPLASYSHNAMKPVAGPNFTPGGFDPPRTMQPGNAFWDLWNAFRERMVHNFIYDMAGLVQAAGINPDRWYSHQVPTDYVWGTSPSMVNKNARYYSSASPLWTANIVPFGSTGATLYDVKFPTAFARTTKNIYPVLSTMSSNWGIMEFDAEVIVQGLNVTQSTPDVILEQYLRAYSYSPHLINFWRWIEATGECHIKGTNKEIALRAFVQRIRDKARSTDLTLVYSPPKVAGLSGQYSAAPGGAGVQTKITGKIWDTEPWNWKTWGDFAYFEVYRGTTPGFAADPAHYMGKTTEYLYNDSKAAQDNIYFYKWQAVNVKGGKGPLSDEIQIIASATPMAIIAGWIRTAAGAGIPGVAIAFSNGGGTATTDPNGAYTKLIAAGWTGTAVPAKTGYTFNPSSRAYANLSANAPAEDYVGAILTYPISGTVTVAAGGGQGGSPTALAGVTMTGLPGNPVTDAAGRYTETVDYGWSGTVTPNKTGYVFAPINGTYASVTANQAAQDYSATVSLQTITVTAPNGGEGWEEGTSYPITWTTTGSVGNVKIDYSTNGGSTWIPITASAPNSGSYGWLVPNTPSATCLVMVSVAPGGSPLDVSDTSFTIVARKKSSIALNRKNLIFGAVAGGKSTPAQPVIISNTGGGTLSWTVTSAGSANFLQVTPGSGTGNSLLQVGVSAAGLGEGTYTGTVTVTDPNAVNSPQAVNVTLRVLPAGSSTVPFGSFDTPVEGSTVRSTIPVTGWVLDDLGVASLKIYRNPLAGETAGANGLVYIGDATFVEGARQDLPQIYPNYPLNTKAGWGYMMLTNFLPPNQGNGVYRLHAIATDVEGNSVELGTKTITCDNAHLTKPFGAIDTPAQGGDAAGATYNNFGWALTPMPNMIPLDGSTIFIWVDGVLVGHPSYNNYRADIATRFPGLANTNGAIGVFTLDTTRYANGVHTIAWSVRDNAGNEDGIGSRFFNIINTGAAQSAGGAAGAGNQIAGGLNVDRTAQSGFSIIADAGQNASADNSKARNGAGLMNPTPPIGWSTPQGDLAASGASIETIGMVMSRPLSFEPLLVKRGFSLEADPEIRQPDNNGMVEVEMGEVDRLEIDLGRAKSLRGGLVAGDEILPLPIGSTLNVNARNGTFSWMPGPGFLGTYDLVILRETGAGLTMRIPIRVVIKPKNR